MHYIKILPGDKVKVEMSPYAVSYTHLRLNQDLQYVITAVLVRLFAFEFSVVQAVVTLALVTLLLLQ